MALWLLALWTVTAIEPFDRRDWLLENLLVFLYSGLLVVQLPPFHILEPVLCFVHGVSQPAPDRSPLHL